MKATKRQKDYLRGLLCLAGFNEDWYISDFTDDEKSSIDELEFEESSAMIDDLKQLLGLDEGE